MATSSILQFAGTDNGNNLLSDADYASDAQRPIGNQPGVARAKLVNKALRQTSAIAAAIAQFIADRQGTNISDSTAASTLQTAIAAAFRGRLIRTLVYYNVGGTQYVSVNGASGVTAGAGTYTPDPLMQTALVQVQGAGGGGGGTATTGTNQYAIGSAGASGAYASCLLTAGQIGASQPITTGSPGAFGGANGNGGTGGTTSFGSLVSAPGGPGGQVGLASSVSFQQFPAPPGNAATGGNIVSTYGIPGASGINTGTLYMSGSGGGSPLFNGAGGGKQVTGTGAGQPGGAHGAGGSGGSIGPTSGASTGGPGAGGAILIQEFA